MNIYPPIFIVRFTLLGIAGISLMSLIANTQIAHADVLVTNCDADLDIPGETYIFQNNITGNCRIIADNIVLDGNDFTLTGNINGNGVNLGDDGFSFTVQNFLDISGDIVSAGNYAGGAGGDLVITNTNFSNINTQGGDEANGGSVTLVDSVGSGNIETSGGYSYGIGIPGNGGAVTLNNSSVADIVASGGSSYEYGGNGGEVILTNSSSVTNITTDGGTGIYGGGNGGNVTIENSSVANEISATGNVNGTLTLVDDAPIITLLGDNPLEIGLGEDYDDTGATAIDEKDGNLTDFIVIDGVVGEDAGEYTITYTVSDFGTSVVFNGAPQTIEANEVIAERTVSRITQELLTLSAEDITQTSALLRGQVISGTFPVGTLGFAFSNAPLDEVDEPGLYGSADELGTIDEETGIFTIVIDNENNPDFFEFFDLDPITCNTTYYYTAIGYTETLGDEFISAPNEISFTTLPCEDDPEPRRRTTSGGRASAATLAQMGITLSPSSPSNNSQIQVLMQQLQQLQALVLELQGQGVPASSPTSLTCQPFLRQGSRGSEVARLQTKLGIPSDGVFGSQTAQAVRSFQALNNLLVDGIAGSETCAVLSR